MNMSDEKFESAETLRTWLISKDIDSGKAATACTGLFTQGFDQPSTLVGISGEELTGCGISTPIARHISNKLKEPQQDGELSCCSRILVFNMVFEYENAALFSYSKCAKLF